MQRSVAELEAGEARAGRVRRPGAGRKPIAQTDPGVPAALLGLVEPTRRGNPESALSLTTLSLQHLAGELARRGHKVSTWTVANLPRAEVNLPRAQVQPAGQQQADRGTPTHPGPGRQVSST